MSDLRKNVPSLPVGQSSTGLFVGDLASHTTERDLQTLFSAFGSVTAIEVKRGRHGDSLLHGFVDLNSEAAALAAIQGLNGRKFKGRKMRVNWTNTKVLPSLESQSWIQLQVNFVSKNMNCTVHEEWLETVFSQFGEIADILVKRQVLDVAPFQVSGYGFVYFACATSAMRALSVMKGIVVDGVFLECFYGFQGKEGGDKKTSKAEPSLADAHRKLHVTSKATKKEDTTFLPGGALLRFSDQSKDIHRHHLSANRPPQPAPRQLTFYRPTANTDRPLSQPLPTVVHYRKEELGHFEASKGFGQSFDRSMGMEYSMTENLSMPGRRMPGILDREMYAQPHHQMSMNCWQPTSDIDRKMTTSSWGCAPSPSSGEMSTRSSNSSDFFNGTLEGWNPMTSSRSDCSSQRSDSFDGFESQSRLSRNYGIMENEHSARARDTNVVPSVPMYFGGF